MLSGGSAYQCHSVPQCATPPTMPNSICSEAAAAKPVFSPHRQNFRICFVPRMLGSIQLLFMANQRKESAVKFEKGKRTYVAVECDRCGRKEACKTLPRAPLLSQIQIQLQIHTHTEIQ